jgi:NitT/TauT family transport system substrate-binding protein
VNAELSGVVRYRGRRAVLRSWAITVAVLCSSCTRDEGAPVTEQGRLKLRVVTQPYLAHAPLLIADAESLWAKHGLDVELISMASAADAMPLLLSGKVDVLASNPAPGLFNAAARGGLVRVVAERGYLDPDGCSFYTIIARAGLVRDGKPVGPVRRISIDRQPAMIYVITSMLALAGLSIDSLEARAVPHAAEMDALARGSLDIALAGEPWITRNISRGSAEIWLRAEHALPNHQFGFVFYGPGVLARNREAGRRFMLAYRDAVRLYLQGKTDRNVAIISAAIGDTPEVIRSACWPAMRLDGRIDTASLRAFQDWAVRRGYLDSGIAVSQLWDSSFVAYADSVGARP